MTKENIIRQAYEAAVERYAAVGVDVKEAMDKLQKISLSMHCWQADDVSGFENQGGSLTGGTCPHDRRSSCRCPESGFADRW
jgi:L-rhamnose isomerase